MNFIFGAMSITVFHKLMLSFLMSVLHHQNEVGVLHADEHEVF